MAFIHILSSRSLVLSLYWECFVFSPPLPPSSSSSLLLSDKCHSSLSPAATIADLFQRGADRGGERERERDESEGGMKRKMAAF